MSLHEIAEWLAQYKDAILPVGVAVGAATLVVNVWIERRRWRARLRGHVVAIGSGPEPSNPPRPDESWITKHVLLRNASHRPTAVVQALVVGDDCRRSHQLLEDQVEPALPIPIAPWSVCVVTLLLKQRDIGAERVYLVDLDDKFLLVRVDAKPYEARMASRLRALRYRLCLRWKPPLGRGPAR